MAQRDDDAKQQHRERMQGLEANRQQADLVAKFNQLREQVSQLDERIKALENRPEPQQRQE